MFMSALIWRKTTFEEETLIRTLLLFLFRGEKKVLVLKISQSNQI